MGKSVIHAELMEIFGVSSKTLTAYRKEGMPFISGGGIKRGAPTVYDTEETIAWYVEKQIAKRYGGDPSRDIIDKEYEQGRLAQAQADGKVLDNDVRKGELASVELMTRVLAKVSSQIAAVLDSIPQKIKRRVPSLTSADIEIIKKEIIKTQNAAATMDFDLEEAIDDSLKH